MTSRSMPSQRHSSSPVEGLYDWTNRWLLTISSSWSPTLMAMGVPQPTRAARGVRHRVSPVRASRAMTNAFRFWSW